MTVQTCLVSDRQKRGSLEPCDFHKTWDFFFCSFRSICLCSTCTLEGQGEDKEGICMHHMTRSYSICITCHTFGRFSRHYMNLVVIQVLTCSVTLWHFESFGLLNYGRPFFPISSLLSPSCNRHLTCIPFSILHPFQSRCSYSSSLQFTLKHLLTVLSRFILTTCPIHCNLFFLVSATMSYLSIAPSIPA